LQIDSRDSAKVQLPTNDVANGSGLALKQQTATLQNELTGSNAARQPLLR
jgi:hypothetical protein